MSKTALIFGIGGQDGSLLADTLLEKSYEVAGIYPFFDSLKNIRHLEGKISLHRGDLLDPTSIYRVIERVAPDEIYNEADLDSIGWSKEIPSQSFDTTAKSLITLLEAVKLLDPEIKVFQPLSITMFGNSPPPQSESSRLDPRSPYAIAKASCFHICRYYREEQHLFVSTAIYGNHDSPRRSEDYLLHKICNSAVRMARGEQESLTLGNINQQVDIGYAKEYVEAARQILQLPKADDFLIATGVAWPIIQMVKEAFSVAGVSGDYYDLVKVDAKLANSGIVAPTYIGNVSKAFRTFGWKPKYTVKELIPLLVEAYRDSH